MVYLPRDDKLEQTIEWTTTVSIKTGRGAGDALFDLRRDFMTGKYVAISEDRANRPNVAGDSTECPFCEKNTHMTPPSIFWSDNKRIRVFNNLYPALPAYSEATGGFHEVIVDTPVHDADFTCFTDEHIAEVLTVLRNRVRFMSLFDKIKYVQVFKNNGAKSGASISHSHWQIVGLPVIPDRQMTIYSNQLSYHNLSGGCYLCNEVINHFDNGLNSLMVYENELAAAYVSATALYYYGIDIVTREHISDFKDISEDTTIKLAAVIGKSVRGLKSVLGDISYNICVVNMPYYDLRKIGNEFCHFYIQIIPRIGNFAGFELSTGCHINSVIPEQAAFNLRNAVLSDKL